MSMVGVWDCAIARNENVLATAGDDATIKIWDTAAPHTKLQATLAGHVDEVNCCEFSSCGQKLVSGSSDNTVRVWDVVNEKHTSTLFGFTSPVNGAHFSYDSDVVVGCSQDFTCKLWCLETNQVLQTFAHNHVVCACDLSATKQFTATCSHDQSTNVWDTETGKIVTTINCKALWCEFSEESSLLLTSLFDGAVLIHDSRCAQITVLDDGNECSIFSSSFVPCSWLVVSCGLGTINVWDTRTTKPTTTLNVHDSQYIYRCAVSDSGTKLVTCSPIDSSTILWGLDVATKQLSNLGTLRNHDHWEF